MAGDFQLKVDGPMNRGIKVQIQCRNILRGVVPFGVKKTLANMPEKSPQYWASSHFLHYLIFTYFYFLHHAALSNFMR